jgi:TonB family protein
MSCSLLVVACCMKQGSGLVEPVVDRTENVPPEPRFVVDLDPWAKVFFRNLRDSFRAPQPGLKLSSPPAAFWEDVFVAPHLPWRRFLESAFYHVAIIAVLSGATRFWPQPRIKDRSSFSRQDVIYYSASEYLPPLNTGRAHPSLPKQGAPEHAPQAIISVPPEPDNRTQTIVVAPKLKLEREVAMPNIVAWPQNQPTVPLAATTTSASEVRLPALPPSVVAPAPRMTAMVTQSPALPQDVIAPPPVVQAALIQRLGDLNVGRMQVVSPAPKMTLAEQRTSLAMNSNVGPSGQAVVPPPPSVETTGTTNGGRLIALGIHPITPSAPLAPPPGNRSGIFAATPQGKSGAAGSPDIPASNDHDSTTGAGSMAGVDTTNIPPGLLVGTSPDSAKSSPAPTHGQNGATNSSASHTSPDDSRLMAKATPPRVTAVPQSVTSGTSYHSPTELEKEVFGARKFYSMTLNMPNLNSAGGSWVMRFAELKEDPESGDLVAPLATRKVDPGYPAELMRRNVQGTVTLYAVIRSDGSVGEVRVLRGVDERLDEYARSALSHWHFHPATKNGSAVDLEAVVLIPFRAIRY